MTQCSGCALAFPDGTLRCPVCERILSLTAVARRAGLWIMITLPLAVVCAVAIASGTIESRLLWKNTGPADPYRATLEYLRSVPDLGSGKQFSDQNHSVVERWGPTRWRVAGYVDTQVRSAGRVHTYYSCVLHYEERRWEVEDVHFERLE